MAVRRTFYFRDNLSDYLNKVAKEEDRTVTDILMEAIREHKERRENAVR